MPGGIIAFGLNGDFQVSIPGDVLFAEPRARKTF